MKKQIIKQPNHQINSHGFTLLETIITLTIVTLLVGVFLVNYRGGSRATDLTFATQQMASDIRLAQNNALGLMPYGGLAPSGGWGIHFDSVANNRVYLLFADTNNNKIYDAGESLPVSGGQSMALPATIIISELKTGGSSRGQVDVAFLPPDPITRIYYGAFSSSTDAVITLKETISGKTQNLNINILGLIEAQ